MPYIVICQKADGSIEVAAHPGEAGPELLQDAQPAQSLDEALQLARDVLGEGAPQDDMGSLGERHGRDDGAITGADQAAPTGAEGMPMADEDDEMAAGFKRAKKGY